MTTKKPRKDRSDMTVGNFEKKHGVPPGTVRNPDGRDTRGDKKLGTVRKQSGKKGGKKSASDLTLRAWEKTYENRRESKSAA